MGAAVKFCSIFGIGVANTFVNVFTVGRSESRKKNESTASSDNAAGLGSESAANAAGDNVGNSTECTGDVSGSIGAGESAGDGVSGSDGDGSDDGLILHVHDGGGGIESACIEFRIMYSLTLSNCIIIVFKSTKFTKMPS